METRISDLESRMAFLEKGLSDLDEVIREVADRMANLAREVERMRTVVASLEGPESHIDEPPPHY